MPFFCPLASGSKGNCSVLSTDNTTILIDAGLSCKQIETRLSTVGKTLDEIDAIFITHEHMDHIRGIKVLCNQYNFPIICNADTAKGIYDNLHLDANYNIFTTNEYFSYKDLEIFPFSILHDTLDPVAFRFKYKNMRIGVCTDLGFVTTYVKKNLKNCHYLYIEANHEPSMVHASPRSHIYKTRVLGRQGHLSNDQSADLLSEVVHEHLNAVYLAHLSEECNRPDMALQKVKEKLSKNITLHIAWQNKPSQITYFD